MLTDQLFKYNVDSPEPSKLIEDMGFVLRGWITAGPGSRIEEPALYDGQTLISPLNIVERPDVVTAFPGQAVLGFSQYFSVLDFPSLSQSNVSFLVNKQLCSFPVALNFSPTVPELARNFQAGKQAKFEKIREIIACPVCGNPALSEQSGGLNLKCGQCRSIFPVSPNSFNFLSDDIIKQFGVKPTGNVSSNGYDPIALGIIEQFKNGLVLDNGAGLRNTYYGNVVNFEIVDYLTTDVLGVGEKLPFKSGVFDAVFSLSVLEHVTDPFACAREIARVLKPGGTLYAAVPFLQPFHGYPNHYYNMTSSGLKNLFAGSLQIIECGVPPAGWPIWSLSWFLNSYIGGLPQEVAVRFKELKVADLLGNPMTYLDRDYVKNLSLKVNEELACFNYLLARKSTLADGDHSFPGASPTKNGKLSYTETNQNL